MKLIVGNGVIGKRLSLRWKKVGLAHHISTRHRHRTEDHIPFIDLSLQENISLREKYQTVILCAGNSNIAECRNDPAGTRKINVDGTINLARQLEEQGARIIFISSDKVFSGNNSRRRTEDPVNPVTEYGWQKAQAEAEILKLDKSAVLRLTKVIYSDQPLLRSWETDLLLGKTITAFSDMWFAPVSVNMVLNIIDFLVEKEAIGIWHGSSTHEITYRAAADHLAQCRGVNLNLVHSSLAMDKNRYNVEDSSRYASLDMEKISGSNIEPENPIDTIHREICMPQFEQVSFG